MIIRWWESEVTPAVDAFNRESAISVWLWPPTPVLWELFRQLLSTDLLLASISVVLVFAVLLKRTASLFLSVAGMLEILVSLIVAYYIYWGVLGLHYFSSLNAGAAFIILAIGADDIFIFTEAV